MYFLALPLYQSYMEYLDLQSTSLFYQRRAKGDTLHNQYLLIPAREK